MDRKRFLASVTGGALVIPAAKRVKTVPDPEKFTVPRFLRSGDSVGIPCVAGSMTAEELQPAIRTLGTWGFKVRLGNTVGKKDFTFGGTDEERLADLQQMLDDPSLSAILCARGGYGLVRIIDKLDFRKFIAKPKWVIGFSDVTVLHSHIHQNFRIATIHSKMCNSFPPELALADPGQIDSITSIHQALTGRPVEYPVSPDPANRTGTARGILVGGNLKTLETLSGTASDIKTKGRILFLEDTEEYLYSIDRMCWQLKRTGKLDDLAGLILGGFKNKPDERGDEFGRSLYNIIQEKITGAYPVCFNFPVGHQKSNFALRCGMPYELKISPNEVSLKEIVYT